MQTTLYHVIVHNYNGRGGVDVYIKSSNWTLPAGGFYSPSTRYSRDYYIYTDTRLGRDGSDENTSGMGIMGFFGFCRVYTRRGGLGSIREAVTECIQY